jgi:hypothetical protein
MDVVIVLSRQNLLIGPDPEAVVPWRRGRGVRRDADVLRCAADVIGQRFLDGRKRMPFAIHERSVFDPAGLGVDLQRCSSIASDTGRMQASRKLARCVSPESETDRARRTVLSGPTSVLEDADELAQWAKQSLVIALKGPKARRSKRPKARR